MKYVFIFLLGLMVNNVNSQSESSFWQDADNFFKANVADGMVDYVAIEKNPASLSKLVQDIKAADKAYLKNKAFLINAYNVLVIDKIVKNYPLTSPTALEGFFTKKDVQLSGQTLSLNEIENTLIRPVFKDARVHFALVCGAKGCPEITNFAYRPEEVERQLESKAKKTLNDANFIKVTEASNGVAISEIFKWYSEDFVSKETTVIDYINKYRTNAIPPNYKVSYYTYDWSLNEKSFEPKKKGRNSR